MKIKLRNFYLFSVPVNFKIANFIILFSNHLVVELRFKGIVGVGEGVLYQTSPKKVLEVIPNIKEFLTKNSSLNFSTLRTKLLQTFNSYPGVVCAFDLALWDLEAKLVKKPVFRLINRQAKRKKIKVTQQLFIEKEEEFKLKLRKILQSETGNLKLKAGGSINKDIDRIKYIKKTSKGKMEIQLDLNKASTYEEIIDFGIRVKRLVKAWEEPLAGSFRQLRKIRQKVGLPIILDESIKDKASFRRAVKLKAFDILNIKFSRLGGLTAALEFARLCRKNNIKVGIGCSEELGVATAGQLHLALGLGRVYGFEALGSERLGFDLTTQAIKIKQGLLDVPKGNGLGINFSLAKLEKAGKKFGFPIAKEFKNKNKLLCFYFKKRVKSKFVNGWLFLRKKIYG